MTQFVLEFFSISGSNVEAQTRKKNYKNIKSSGIVSSRQLTDETS
jgi:hypothetical protein